VTTPLYQAKAELFKTLGHPARIRLLELLSEGERSVSELLPDVGLESSHLSQQLGVLRRAGLVTTRKQGTAVYYVLVSPAITDLLADARGILKVVLADRLDVMRDGVPTATR
jgi:DNA-binding transcriptional ArsR family regulator